jgi:lysophospholipid acyltransferase (LPLAT)-like uncharacterized protein
MAIKSPLARKAIGYLSGVTLKVLRSTIDWKAVYCDPTVDPVHPGHCRLFVFACWHEMVVMPLALRGHRKMLAMASLHGDGDIISTAITQLGWNVVRGSTSRGSVAALLRMLRAGDQHLNLTPDGPRGPRRTMSSGAIFLASKLGRPLVCVGYGYDRPWRMRSWDRFAVPRPFCRGRAVFGPPLRVPGNLDREGLECYRSWFEDLLTFLTEDAERWAEGGQRRPGELPMLVGRAPARMLRWHPSHAPQLPESLHQRWVALGNPPMNNLFPTAVSRAA